MSSNKLTGTIPSTVSALSQLQSFWIELNDFVGPLFPQISCCTNLITLQAHNAPITGTIPSDIAVKYPKLQVLNLKDTSITGTVPPEIYMLTNLKELLIQSQGLEGLIMTELGNLSNLGKCVNL